MNQQKVFDEKQQSLEYQIQMTQRSMEENLKDIAQVKTMSE